MTYILFLYTQADDNMKKLLAFILLIIPLYAFSQSETTRSIEEKYEDAFGLFFYNNTLQMLNQIDDESFDELIKDIDKMKFLRINKASNGINKEEINKYVVNYKDEDYEEMMTMRYEGMNVKILIQESNAVTTGLIFLMDDNESFSILDVKGDVPMNQLVNLMSKVKSMN